MPNESEKTPGNRTAERSTTPEVRIAHKIYSVRGRKVMLDSDLADLYGVPTKSLNLGVRRNLARFPEDFMFRMSAEETRNLRFQIETSRSGHGGRRTLPYAFTEQGVAMLSSVLRSKRAIDVNINVMRAFVRLREILGTNKKLSWKLDEMERKYDSRFGAVFEAIRELMRPAETVHKRRIGFRVGEEE